jgi:2-polyprenyl-3-methyl-5-hydroxy-6-metoxy-1,4-benzoquinol methylase
MNSMSDNKRDFDKEAAQWDENPVRVKVANDVADAITLHVPLNTSMRAMDFGCGTGLLALRIAPLVRSVTGVDSSQGMLDVLGGKISKQKIKNVTTSLVDLDKGGVLTGSYDLIVSSMTLHHIEKIAPLLKQFHECLAPDGYIAIADLDPDDGLFHSDNKGVIHFGFERTAISQAFVEAGFNRIQNFTAAEIEKPTLSGDMRRFTVFLMTGKKTTPA